MGFLQFSFEVGILSIFGQLNRRYKQELKENYSVVNKGYNSFPTNLPGTTYRRAIVVSKVLQLLFNCFTVY